MSGIEVAGLVLGAFPVAIWTLEQYRDVARRMGFWYEIRSEYQRSSNELKFHRLSFERNLEQLLLPLIADEVQLQDLIAEPGGSRWKDPAIHQALEKRLQKSYDLYLEILGEMQRAMQDLNEELAIGDATVQAHVKGAQKNPPKPKAAATSRLRHSFDRNNRNYKLFRVKFSLGERTRTRLFGELQTNNDRLEKLTSTSDLVTKLHAERQGASSNLSAMNSALCKFWNHADRLYKALVGAWNCSCRDQHLAGLILQHRQPLEKDFRLHLCPGEGQIDGAEAWPKCSVQVQLHDWPKVKAIKVQPAIGGSTGNAAPLSTPQHRLKHLTKSALSTEKKKKTPSFQNGKIHSVSQSSTVTVTILEEQQELVTDPIISQDTENSLASLCETLRAGIKPESQLGYTQDDDIRYHITAGKTISSKLPNVKLSDILSGDVKPPLSRRQRYCLAMTIASSFVQLEGTPWIQTPWNKDGVYLARDEDQSTLLLDSPFVIRPFTSVSPTTSQVGDDVADISSLAVVLLELCFGRSIEQHPTRLKFPAGEEQVKAAFDLVAALEWLKDVNDEAGADYAEAVKWCLTGCRTLPSVGSWRRHMVDKVVVPLERCYRYLE